MKNLIRGLLIAVVTSACGSAAITGYYSSKKADLGFFITKIHLNPDSTFKYEFYGDLAYDRATGQYSVNNKIIHLTYENIPPDSLDELSRALATQFSHVRPNKLLIKNRKLFRPKADQNGKTAIPLIKRDGELIWRYE